MRVLFAGTPEIGTATLEAIHAEHNVVAVLTNPDSPSGRKKIPVPSPIKVTATRLDIPVIDSPRLNAAVRESISDFTPDLLVSFAYSKIFGPKFLSLFPLGGINIHPSLLPSFRGPSPIPAAILSREKETGVSVQRTALKMDTGNILGQVVIGLSGTETTETLSDIVAARSPSLVLSVLKALASDTAVETVQDESKATYCKLITKNDGLIHWDEAAEHIEAMMRAYLPWPRAFTMFNGKTLALLDGEIVDESGGEPPGKVIAVDKSRGILIQTGHGQIAVSRLQLQAKKAMFWRDFINGNRSFIGTVLGG